MKILLVKLSSLGDILHNLPMVWDLRKQYQDAQIDWVVEEGYVPLLQPLKTEENFNGIDRIIPIAFRRWRKLLGRGKFIQSIQEFLAFRKKLQQVEYDIVIDSQGLIKSAFVTHIANKSSSARIIGLGNKTEYSGYEPLVRKFYTEAVQVPFNCHAVDRSRWLAAVACNLPPPVSSSNPPIFYGDDGQKRLFEITNSVSKLSVTHFGFDIQKPYVLCFHSTAGQSKRWAFESWVAVGKGLSNRGLQVVLPWGNHGERNISNQLAQRIPGAVVPGSFGISDAFYLVIQAKLCIGVDTGLTHLAAVLNCPTIELYCDSPKWKTEGYWSSKIINLGDKCASPTVNQVFRAISNFLD